MATPFSFKEQDSSILQQLGGLESQDHLPDNFVILDYNSFSEEFDSFFACEFLSENFHVIIITEYDMLKVNFKHLDSKHCTVIPAVPSRMLRNVAHPSDHIATIVMAHLTEYAKSDGRRAYYCLSADDSFPINTDMIDLIGDEFVYCCVIKSVKDFLSLEKWFQKSDDPVKMRLYRLFQNGVPRDKSDSENCGKIMCFINGDMFGTIRVQTLWEELKTFGDNYEPYPLHVSVTTSFPTKRKDSQIVHKYPEIIKRKFYRFLIYLPDASEYEIVEVLEALRVQRLAFRSTVWSRKFDKDTKAKKFGSLGYTYISKDNIYKLGDHVLEKTTSPESLNYQTKNFKDLFLFDDHIKQLLLEAKQQGATMKVRHAKILFCGASGAGKTSFCRLLKNTPLDKERNSTGLGESQQIMASAKATMKSNEWTELDPAEEINQLKLHLKHGKLTKTKIPCIQAPTDKSITKDESQSGATGATVAKSSGRHMIQVHVKQLPKKVPEVEKCLSSNFFNAEKQDSSSTEPPEIWDILTLLDTGGQPQFINMLPAVNSSATITFVVLNMAGEGETLKESIQVHHFRNGVRSYEPYPLHYTNEDLIKCLVALLKDTIVRDVPLPIEVISKEATDHKPGLCFVGTHRDKVTQKTVDGINKKLEKLVEHLGPNDNIHIFNLGTMLFAVDNTIAGEDTSPHSIAKEIRLIVKKMVEEKAVYEVPITWILLELEIRRRCKKQKRSFLQISEVLEIYDNIVSDDDTADIELEVKAALRFHHTFGVLLYFHDVPGMNDYVISNPQWLFANLTNLVCCSFDKTIVDHVDIKKLKTQGILSESLIKKINTASLGGISIEHFFKLLQHLKIVAPFPHPDSSNYLMLSILDSYKDEKSSILDSLSPPLSGELLIQFKSGTLPRGIFCCLVVQLVQTKSEDWALQPALNGQRCMYENLVVFCVKSSGHYLVLLDRVTHLEIQLRPSSKEEDREAPHIEVQQCITDTLKEVCLCVLDDFKYGFYCNNHKCLKSILTLTASHMTGQRDFPPNLQCEDHGLVDIKSHNSWCKASSKGKIRYTCVITHLDMILLTCSNAFQ